MSMVGQNLAKSVRLQGEREVMRADPQVELHIHPGLDLALHVGSKSQS